MFFLPRDGCEIALTPRTLVICRTAQPPNRRMRKTHQNVIRLALPCAAALILSLPATAGNVVKTNNTDNLNLGSSWVGGVPPASTDVAVWDNTITAGNTTLLGANLTWAGIKILDPGGLITISAGNTLTLGG